MSQQHGYTGLPSSGVRSRCYFALPTHRSRRAPSCWSRPARPYLRAARRTSRKAAASAWSSLSRFSHQRWRPSWGQRKAPALPAARRSASASCCAWPRPSFHATRSSFFAAAAGHYSSVCSVKPSARSFAPCPPALAAPEKRWFLPPWMLRVLLRWCWSLGLSPWARCPCCCSLWLYFS